MSENELFKKGFNHGYQLARHEPALLENLLRSAKDNQGDYFHGLTHGKKQLEKENFAAKMKEANKDRDRSNDIEQ